MKTPDEVMMELIDIANRIVAETSGIEEQKAAIKAYLSENPQVLEAHRDYLYDRGVNWLLYNIRHRNLTELKESSCTGPIAQFIAKPTTRGAEAIEAAGEAAARSFLREWLMPDGRALHDWTGLELIREAEEEEAQEQGHREKKLFYRELGHACGENPVGRRVGDRGAVEMWRRIRGKSVAETYMPRDAKRIADDDEEDAPPVKKKQRIAS